ncbi:hypothetical protein ACFVXC_17985 [Streptomyces sp. NPDC058257]|uniref:hypothetical protein n=1 Tax=Streptomyces sp. NPDC058257 TaxID=3346409 RepID=UPI0036EC98E8
MAGDDSGHATAGTAAPPDAIQQPGQAAYGGRGCGCGCGSPPSSTPRGWNADAGLTVQHTDGIRALPLEGHRE